MNPSTVKFVAFGLSVAAASSGLTYWLTSTTLKREREAYIESEIEKFKVDYAERKFGTVIEEKPDLESVVRAKARDGVSDIVAEMGYAVDDDDADELEVDDFKEVLDEDEDEEYVPSETVKHPVAHVIDFTEWSESPEGWDQEVLIYYEEDEVLATDSGDVIVAVEATLGTGWIHNFGVGSNDANVVYVRNKNYKLDYEVLLNPGSYSEEVHGIKLKKSNRKKREDG